MTIPKCEVHEKLGKLVPAGVSRRTGRPYDAFYGCPTMGCKWTAPAPNEPSYEEMQDTTTQVKEFEKEMEQSLEKDDAKDYDDESPMKKSDWRRKDEMIARIALAKEFIKRGEDFDNAKLNSDLEKWMHFVLTGELK